MEVQGNMSHRHNMIDCTDGCPHFVRHRCKNVCCSFAGRHCCKSLYMCMIKCRCTCRANCNNAEQHGRKHKHMFDHNFFSQRCFGSNQDNQPLSPRCPHRGKAPRPRPSRSTRSASAVSAMRRTTGAEWSALGQRRGRTRRQWTL